jgi:lipopolysaccharide/colanic/teichoic acid biosynthesis glycosyltransferase
VRVAKRALDIAVASSVLIVTAPILTASALAIKVSGPGPVLYRQARIGRHGRSFEILKFRTMTAEEELEPSWAIAHHRVTRVGRVLRRASIDELPQLINVLKGDMSIVGPRPERPHFVEQFSEVVPGYADRHRVHGGITGLAQVNGRSRGLDSIPERVRLDNAYIESQSLWGDIVIMIRTLQVVFRGDRGA